MKRLFLFVGLCLMTNLLFAQKDDFEKGVIFLKDGTSKEGYIQRNTLQQNGQNIPFKENLTAKTETFGPTQLDRFEFLEDGTIFESVVILF